MVFSELRTGEPDRKFLLGINLDLPWPAVIAAAALHSNVKARIILVTQGRCHHHAKLNDYSGANHQRYYDHAPVGSIRNATFGPDLLADAGLAPMVKGCSNRPAWQRELGQERALSKSRISVSSFSWAGGSGADAGWRFNLFINFTIRKMENATMTKSTTLVRNWP